MPIKNKALEIADLTFVQDTREKLPLDLAPANVVVDTLCTGDYSVVGLEHVVRIERKALADLVMCVGRERTRFEKEIQRLHSFPVRYIAVEADLRDILQQRYRSQVHPNSVIGSCASWSANGIPTLFLSDRKGAAAFVSKILLHTARAAAAGRYSGCEAFVESVRGAQLGGAERAGHIVGDDRQPTLPRQEDGIRNKPS